MPVINKTSYGQLVYCEKCGLYHFEFGNLNFNFTEEELITFTTYINSIQGDYYNQVNRHTTNRRKILLPTRLKGFHFCLNPNELNEMKYLLNKDGSKSGLVKLNDIHYEFCNN